MFKLSLTPLESLFFQTRIDLYVVFRRIVQSIEQKVIKNVPPIEQILNLIPKTLKPKTIALLKFAAFNDFNEVIL